MIGKHKHMIGLLKILPSGEPKIQTDSFMELRKLQMDKCKNCNCDCHCNTGAHSASKGVCHCENCRCKEPEGVVIDDTNECEACQ